MQTQTFDINIFNTDSQYFLSNLPEKAKDEVNSFLQYIVFKYNIEPNRQQEAKKKFAPFFDNPLPVKNFVKYTREELHER